MKRKENKPASTFKRLWSRLLDILRGRPPASSQDPFAGKAVPRGTPPRRSGGAAAVAELDEE